MKKASGEEGDEGEDAVLVLEDELDEYESSAIAETKQWQ